MEREWPFSNYRNWEEKKQIWPADGPTVFRLESEAFPPTVPGALAPMKEKEKKDTITTGYRGKKLFGRPNEEGNEWDGG